MIKAILFDFDGVICDSEPIYFEYKIMKLREFGFEPDVEYLKTHVGENFRVMFNREYNVPNKEEIISTYFKGFDQFHVDYVKALNKGIFEFVDECHKKGIKCYICSNANPKKMESAIEQLNLRTHFDEIYTSTLLGVSKPNPEFYYRILHNLNLNKEDVIVIEDSMKGIQAAKDIGLTVFAKKESYFNIDQSLADYHIDNFNEIFEFI